MSDAKTFKLAVCSSAAFYTEVIELSYKIEELGFEAVLPSTAQKMKREGLDNVEVIADWSKSSIGYHGKAELIRKHFKEIERCDAVLVVNYTKHGQENYIGPNVLIEMAAGFYLNKPIYVLNDAPMDSPLIDEILGLEPIFLKGDLTRLRPLLKSK